LYSISAIPSNKSPQRYKYYTSIFFFKSNYCLSFSAKYYGIRILYYLHGNYGKYTHFSHIKKIKSAANGAGLNSGYTVQPYHPIIFSI